MGKPGNLLGGVPGRTIRVAIIGVGFRGEGHLAQALRVPDVEVAAICDVDDQMLQRAKNIIQKSGKAMPRIFTGSNYAYRDLLAMKDLDGVIIATPWEWHSPMILDFPQASNT